MSESEPDFDILFAADLEPTRYAFRIQGKECWVDLRPMDAGDANRYGTLAMRLIKGEDVDMHTIQLYLVEKTLQGWCVWRTSRRKDNGEEVWEQDLSENVSARERRSWIENWKPTREFWDWLVERCLILNGLLEDQGKNSPASSKSSRKKPLPN